MTKITRRKVVASMGAAAALTQLPWRASFAQGKPDIVVGGAQPITGVFSFAGVAMHAGLGDYCAWRNANGGVMGHQLRYVAEDTGFKLDQGVAVFKKIMASDKPSFFFGDSTQWSKAVAQDAIASGATMTSSPSLASAMADPVGMPHHFIPGPTYGALHEVLMEHIARTAKGAKPKIALIYADTEFGRDGIPASKARAEKLGLPIVAEIVTKQAGIEVAPEVARLRRAQPDIAIFQGYVVAPVPEFVKQFREAGMKTQAMATCWGMDRPAYEALAAMNESLSGVMPYRYPHDTESKMIATMREYVAKVRPDQKHISIFYECAWLAGMVFAEIAERCIKAGKPLTLANMKPALESMKDWDTGGLTGLPADLSRHQIASGRLYGYDLAKKQMEPIGEWIRV